MATKLLTADTIKRSVLIADKINDAVKTLALDAAKLLGYDRLANEITAPLRDVLVKLEIEVLNEKQVLAYQDQIAAKAKKEAFEKLKADEGFDEYYDDAPDFEWVVTRIENYAQPIPEFVLAKAVEIKKEFPAVSFYVEHLDEVDDPFLIAQYGSERFYVEVWDEPEFEGRITKPVSVNSKKGE